MKISSEYLDAIKKGYTDLSFFSRYFLGIELHDGQKRAEEQKQKHNAQINLHLWGNQAGKTVLIAVRHIHKCFYKKMNIKMSLSTKEWEALKYKTVNLAPSTKSTSVLFDTILKIVRSEFLIRDVITNDFKPNKCKLGYFVTKITTTPYYVIYWENNAVSEFYTLGLHHGDTIQGDQYMYGSYDEAGLSKSLAEERLKITTRLQTYAAELDIITTPDQSNPGALQDLWDMAELGRQHLSGYNLIRCTVWENIYKQRVDIERNLEVLTPEERKQVAEGDIIFSGSTYFSRQNLSDMFTFDVPPVKDPEEGATYWMGVDTAQKEDSWAITVIRTDCWPFEVVRWSYVKGKNKEPFEHIAHTAEIFERYKNVGEDCYMVLDGSNEAGRIYYSELKSYRPYMQSFGIEKKTGKNLKYDMLKEFKKCLDKKGIRCNKENKELLSQMTIYHTEDDKIKTDAVMSLMLAVYKPYKYQQLKDKRAVFTIGEE